MNRKFQWTKNRHIKYIIYTITFFQYIGGYKNVPIASTLCFLLLDGAAIFRETIYGLQACVYKPNNNNKKNTLWLWAFSLLVIKSCVSHSWYLRTIPFARVGRCGPTTLLQGPRHFLDREPWIGGVPFSLIIREAAQKKLFF